MPTAKKSTKTWQETIAKNDWTARESSKEWPQPLDSDEEDEEDSRVRRYGYVMLAPILLMTIFSLRQWWRLEKIGNRLRTLPLVFMQCFPQYRALRILYLGLWKKAGEWRTELDVYNRDLSSLGMYICFNVKLIANIFYISFRTIFGVHSTNPHPYLPACIK